MLLMKEKIFNKMIEYGWNLGENEYEDFNNVYDIHKSFLDSCYDYKCEVEEDNEILNMNDISVSSFEDMLDFITDFLRAIEDLDKVDKIGNRKISLYNKHDIGECLSNICSNDTKIIEYKIRECAFNGNKLCELLNGLEKDLFCHNWKVIMETDNTLVVSGIDVMGNVMYLEIGG